MRSWVERAVLDNLVEGLGERYAVRPGGARAVTRALERALGGADPIGAVRRLVQLTVALDERLDSPTAAEQLRGVLRGSAGAMRIVRTKLRAGDGLTAVRRHARARGDRSVFRAGRQDAPRPRGALRIQDLVDPLGRRWDAQGVREGEQQDGRGSWRGRPKP